MVSVFAFALLFLGWMAAVSQCADGSLSVVLPRPADAPGFPYFIFITGVFYGFIAGVIFTGYLTWKYILKPNQSTAARSSKGVGRSVSTPTSPTSPRPKKIAKVKNAVVQGPVMYNPQPGKKHSYDPLADKHWGAWWY